MKLLLVSAMILFSAALQAATVYTFDYGDWHLRGYRDAVDIGDNACVLSTAWADGKKIQVNIFPKYDGSNNITMTLLNPRWNNAPWTVGSSFDVRFDFTSYQYAEERLSGRAQIYTGNKIILRGMNNTFLKDFTYYDTMTLFAGSAQELPVSLSGTAALTNDINNCIAEVLNNPVPGNH